MAEENSYCSGHACNKGDFDVFNVNVRVKFRVAAIFAAESEPWEAGADNIGSASAS